MKVILTREQIAQGVHIDLDDELLAQLPEISRHNEPQDSPQEYPCGCVAITHITDRDARLDQRPFEMRLAIICETEACKTKRPKLTTIFIISVTGRLDPDDRATTTRAWADQYWDTYGFDFDTSRCRSGSVYAWSLYDNDEELRAALAADRIEFQTILVDFDEWLPIAPEDRTWRSA